MVKKSNSFLNKFKKVEEVVSIKVVAARGEAAANYCCHGKHGKALEKVFCFI
jgi:hypothetical protein